MDTLIYSKIHFKVRISIYISLTNSIINVLFNSIYRDLSGEVVNMFVKLKPKATVLWTKRTEINAEPADYKDV